MRVSAFLVLSTLVACASSSSPNAGPDGAVAIDAAIDGVVPPTDAALDAPPMVATWRDDTAPDFADGVTQTHVAVEAYGALTTAAYYTGGLLVRGSDTGTFTDAVNTTWAQVIAMPSTSRTGIARSTSIYYSDVTPPSVGLTHPDAWTIWYEGEVYLDAGVTTFSLVPDDHVFVEMAAAPGTAFTRIVAASWPNTATGTFNAPSDGWYPIRYALCDGGGYAGIELKVQGPGLPGLQAIPRHRLRARVDGLVGLVESGFDDAQMLAESGHSIDGTLPAHSNWAEGVPADLGVTAVDDWSVRWSGQLRIDLAGAYAFRYVSDDGQRLWIDGQRVLDAFGNMTHDQTTAPIMLEAGWHDVVVDHSESGGNAAAWVTIASGPEGVGERLPRDRLRPVEGRSERYESGVDRTDRAIPSSGQALDSEIVIVVPGGAVVTGVDVGYTLQHTLWNDLEVRLIAPDGQAVVLRPRSGGSAGGVLTERLSRADFNGALAAGTWRLRVNDLLTGNSGTLQDFQLTVHHGAGVAPIATSGVYESAVQDLGGDRAITRVSWVERLPAGADITVRLRSCATADACAAQPWSTPLTEPAGAVPAIPARRFLQYRVDLTSNGDRAPALDQIAIEYAVNP